jgi:hypothetical protein
MTYLIAIAAIFVFLVWRGRVGRVLKGAEWRVAAAVSSVGLFAAAGFEALRGGEVPAVILLVVGLILVGTARWPRVRRPASSDTGGAMSLAEARATLGIGPAATEAEIRAAYSRLIRVAHPDKGGTAGLAAQLNAARDRLLKG